MSNAKLIHALATDPGRVRSHNEDAAAAAQALGAYVLCDGMGGAAAGEIASRVAIDRFLEHLAASAPETRTTTVTDASPAYTSSNSAKSKPQTRLHSAVHAANDAVFELSSKDADLSGMGTTLVALFHVEGPAKDRRLRSRTPKPRFIPPPTLFLANVGDSRCYRRRGGDFLQLSTDHSFVEEQILAGQITADEAVTSPMRNYITRAVGPQNLVEPDIQCYRPQPGDLYLLASDGLTREMTDFEIAGVLALTVPGPVPTQAELHRACLGLIAGANSRGGRDNITVLLLAFL